MGNKSFVRSARIVLILVLIGKIIGFLKQVVFAYFYGASELTDLFFSSYSFVTEISMAVFSAIGIVLLKNYGKEKKKGVDAANRLLSSSMIFSLTTSVAICVIIIFASNWITELIAPGYDELKKKELAMFLKLLCPVIVFSSIQTNFTAVLDYEKKFLPGKILQLLLNSLIIVAVLVFKSDYGVIPLICAVIIAYLVQTIISIINIKEYVNIKLRLINPLKNKTFLRLLKMAVPLFVGYAMIELNSMVDKAVASNLSSGSISSLTYGASINEIVTSLIIGTIASLYYSYASSFVVEKKFKDLKRYLSGILKVLLFILVPITVFVVFFAKDIVSVLYFRGSFDYEALLNTTAVVVGYAFGFIPTMIRSLLVNTHYAYDDVKSPMISGIVAVSSNIILSIILSKYMGLFGISLATSISMVVSSLICFFTIKRHFSFDTKNTSFSPVIKYILVVVILVVASFFIEKYLNVNQFVKLTISFICVFGLYYALLVALGFKQYVAMFIELLRPKKDS